MLLRTLLVTLLPGLVAALSTSCAAAVPSTSCPTDRGLAILTAGSDLVLVGRMEVVRQRLRQEAQKPSPEYLDIPVRIDRVLKGGGIGSATLRFYPKDTPYQPSNEAVLGLADARAILFLTRVEEGPGGLYFAGYTPQALSPATEPAIDAVEAEVARQDHVHRSWRVDTTLQHFGTVRDLIGRLGSVSGDDQQRVFERLEMLGAAAVPAIIAQMDDRRPLRTQAISLMNHSPGAFEGVRHYGPEQVVDGLDAVLNQITGMSFGSIANGGSNRQRDAVVAGWRVYAADLACKQS